MFFIFLYDGGLIIHADLVVVMVVVWPSIMKL